MDPRDDARVDRPSDRERQKSSDAATLADHPADLRTPETPSERDQKLDANPAEAVGKGAGGIAGAHLAAGVGAFLAGPVGMVIGAIAGAVGGWWAGDTIAKGLDKWSEADDEVFRAHYATLPRAARARTYEDVRPAYQLGWLAAHNPDYTGRPFEEIEPDLKRGWTPTLETKYGAWDDVRVYTREAYVRASRSPVPGSR